MPSEETQIILTRLAFRTRLLHLQKYLSTLNQLLSSQQSIKVTLLTCLDGKGTKVEVITRQ